VCINLYIGVKRLTIGEALRLRLILKPSSVTVLRAINADITGTFLLGEIFMYHGLG
jgi:hypothetical protein